MLPEVFKDRLVQSARVVHGPDTARGLSRHETAGPCISRARGLPNVQHTFSGVHVTATQPEDLTGAESLVCSEGDGEAARFWHLRGEILHLINGQRAPFPLWRVDARALHFHGRLMNDAVIDSGTADLRKDAVRARSRCGPVRWENR